MGTQLTCDPLDLRVGLGLDCRNRQGNLVIPVSPPAGIHQFLGHRSNVAPRAFVQLTYNY